MSEEGQEAAPATNGGPRTAQEVRDRMAAIKEQVAAEVDKKWGSPWRTADVFDLKVNTRLTGHTEYRALRGELKEVEAAEAASTAAPEPGQTT